METQPQVGVCNEYWKRNECGSCEERHPINVMAVGPNVGIPPSTLSMCEMVISPLVVVNMALLERAFFSAQFNFIALEKTAMAYLRLNLRHKTAQAGGQSARPIL
jgi:hypothetical protein